MNREGLQGVIHSDPEIMGGTPVFAGTRVPLQNLIDALEGGESIDEFLEGFPSVSRAQVIAVIKAGHTRCLTPEQAREFRLEFQHAREDALKDAEAFEGIIHVVERLARIIHSRRHRWRFGVSLRRACVDELGAGAFSWLRSPLAAGAGLRSSSARLARADLGCALSGKEREPARASQPAAVASRSNRA